MLLTDLINDWHPFMFPDRANVSKTSKGSSVSQNPSGGADYTDTPGPQNLPCSIQPLSLEEIGRLVQVQIRATYKIVFPNDPAVLVRDELDEVGGLARKFVASGTNKFGDSAAYDPVPGMAWVVYATLRS